MKEHQRDVKYSTNATRLKTELVDHAWTTGHTFDFTAATTLAKEDRNFIASSAEEEERGRMASAKPEILRKYLDLEQPDDVVFVTYVFVDGTLENVRAKTRTLAFEPKTAKNCPEWTYCAVGTYQWADAGAKSEMFLVPVALFKDPFLKGRNKLVLCETLRHDRRPPGPGFCARQSSFVAPHRRDMDLSDLTSLELEILKWTADMGAISYDSTPMRDVDERSAEGTDCGDVGRPRRGEGSPQELEGAPGAGFEVGIHGKEHVSRKRTPADAPGSRRADAPTHHPLATSLRGENVYSSLVLER
ncbi:putative glutamine synthetase 1 [Ixodes scapularis]